MSLAAWDRCVDPNLRPSFGERGLPVDAAVDASTKHNSTAIVVTHRDKKAQQVRLVFHRIYQPSPDQPLDFEGTIERTILDLRKRFCCVRPCLIHGKCRPPRSG